MIMLWCNCSTYMEIESGRIYFLPQSIKKYDTETCRIGGTEIMLSDPLLKQCAIRLSKIKKEKNLLRIDQLK